jgi:hypothetical protein
MCALCMVRMHIIVIGVYSSHTIHIQTLKRIDVHFMIHPDVRLLNMSLTTTNRFSVNVNRL